MRRVSHHMGMPISIDIPGCEQELEFDSCWSILSEIDDKYSPFKPTSMVYKIANGQQAINQANNELEEIINLANKFESLTDGYFSLTYKNKFDPSGIIKAWAIQRVASTISGKDYDTFLINAGGDILCNSNTPNYWNIGISNPNNFNQIIGNIKADNTAVATSGTYQKGEHIYNPKTKQPAFGLKSVTVIGKDIIKTDIYATALFAMGYKAISYAKQIKDYKFVIIDKQNIIYSI